MPGWDMWLFPGGFCGLANIHWAWKNVMRSAWFNDSCLFGWSQISRRLGAVSGKKKTPPFCRKKTPNGFRPNPILRIPNPHSGSPWQVWVVPPEIPVFSPTYPKPPSPLPPEQMNLNAFWKEVNWFIRKFPFLQSSRNSRNFTITLPPIKLVGSCNPFEKYARQIGSFP